MSDIQIQDIYTRLESLTQKVNSLELLIGTIGTSQVAIAQISNRLETFTQTINDNFAQVTERFDRVDSRLDGLENRLGRVENVQNRQSTQLDDLQVNVNEILRLLRDRNGGSGL